MSLFIERKINKIQKQSLQLAVNCNAVVELWWPVFRNRCRPTRQALCAATCPCARASSACPAWSPAAGPARSNAGSLSTPTLYSTRSRASTTVTRSRPPPCRATPFSPGRSSRERQGCRKGTETRLLRCSMPRWWRHSRVPFQLLVEKPTFSPGPLRSRSKGQANVFVLCVVVRPILRAVFSCVFACLIRPSKST